MRLRYTRAVHIYKLHDELLRAVPELRPLDSEQAVMTVEGTGSEVTLTVPDGVSVSAIESVIAAHDPTPPVQRNPDAELDAAIQSATTILGLKSAIIGRVKAR